MYRYVFSNDELVAQGGLSMLEASSSTRTQQEQKVLNSAGVNWNVAKQEQSFASIETVLDRSNLVTNPSMSVLSPNATANATANTPQAKPLNVPSLLRYSSNFSGFETGRSASPRTPVVRASEPSVATPGRESARLGEVIESDSPDVSPTAPLGKGERRREENVLVRSSLSGNATHGRTTSGPANWESSTEAKREPEVSRL